MEVFDQIYVDRYYLEIRNGNLPYVVSHYKAVHQHLDNHHLVDVSQLHRAVGHGHFHLIKWLIEVAGVDVNNTDISNCETPLHFIDDTPDEKVKEIVTYMLGKGANHTAINDENMTPLDLFMKKRGVDLCVRQDVVAAFINAGADVTRYDTPWLRKLTREVRRARSTCARTTITVLCGRKFRASLQLMPLPYDVVKLIAKHVYESIGNFEVWKASTSSPKKQKK